MARSVKYEREEVLEKAMQAFWEKGYCATSLAELVEVTDLNPGSLYAAFNSKQDLFLAVLDHYAERSVERVDHILSEADSPLQGISDYFQDLIKIDADPNANYSCLLVNTVLELARQNELVQERVNQHLNTIESVFRHSLEQARNRGELGGDKEPVELAAFLMSNIWGIRVLGGTRSSPERTQSIVKQVLTVLN